MKVMRKSNYDYEDWRGDQFFIAMNVSKEAAEAIADLMNERAGDDSDDFYVVVADDHVLRPDWAP